MRDWALYTLGLLTGFMIVAAESDTVAKVAAAVGTALFTVIYFGWEVNNEATKV